MQRKNDVRIATWSLQHRRPKERTPREVERPPSLLDAGPTGVLGGAVGDDHAHGAAELGQDHLARLPVDDREGGAQSLVPADDLVQASLQRRDVESALRAASYAGHEGDVVEGMIGLELRHE